MEFKVGDKIRQNYGNMYEGVVVALGNQHSQSAVVYLPTGTSYSYWDYPESLELVESAEEKVMISMDKKYRTAKGEDVVLYTVDRVHKGGFTVVGAVLMKNGEHSIRYWKNDGEALNNALDNLVEYNPASELKVDQAIWVRDSNADDWIARHFSHTKNGFVYCFNDGMTSHTTDDTCGWKYFTTENPDKT